MPQTCSIHACIHSPCLQQLATRRCLHNLQVGPKSRHCGWPARLLHGVKWHATLRRIPYVPIHVHGQPEHVLPATRQDNAGSMIVLLTEQSWQLWY